MDYIITTLNKISNVGLKHFSDNYNIVSGELTDNTDAVLVRSQDMLEMDFPSSLKSIARAGAGVNNIPLDRCASQGIVVFNTPGANANAVKELTILGLLLSARNVPAALNWAKELKPNDDMNVAKQVEKGKSQFAGTELMGKTLAVLGLGAIGRKISYAAKDLGMNIVGYDPFVDSLEGIEVKKELSEILPLADYVSLHLPANADTNKMVNKDFLDMMKDGAVLLNFSRDKLVNFDDLLASLDNGKIREYVTDFPTDDVVGKDKIVLLPHLGASTEEAEDNCAVMAVQQTVNFLENGNIVNSVNFPKLDMGPKEHERVAVIVKDLPNPIIDVMELIGRLGAQVGKIMASRREDGISYVLAEIISGQIPAMTFDDPDSPIISMRVIK